MTDLAIVGMECRFPGGVRNPHEYWSFLLRQGDGIIEVPPDRWNLELFYEPGPDAPTGTNEPASESSTPSNTGTADQ